MQLTRLHITSALLGVAEANILFANSKREGNKILALKASICSLAEHSGVRLFEMRLFGLFICSF
jgi:hypothetical protein